MGRIEKGVLALIGVQRGDHKKQADRLLQRMLSYRIFPDDADRMNLDVRQARGGLLLVPQFTLAADTNSGNRPSFTPAAPLQKVSVYLTTWRNRPAWKLMSLRPASSARI